MNENRRYNVQKWIVLTGFCLVYATIYLARYNINNLLPQISEELDFSQLEEDILYSSIFLSYAFGSIINGYVADKYNKKKCIILGIVGSLTFNMLSYAASSWGAFLVLNILNGFSQSIIWVSGLAAMVQWWDIRNRGISVGIINMTSNISYLLTILVPVFYYVGSDNQWRENLIYPMIPVFICGILFVIMFTEKPEKRKLTPYYDPMSDKKDDELLVNITPSYLGVIKHFLSDRDTLIWCGVAFLSSLCRYGLLFWLPEYFSDEFIGFELNQNLTNIALSLGMGAGTLVGCILAGKYFSTNLGIWVTGLAASCAAVIVTFPSLSSESTVLCAIFLCGSLLFTINGMLWMYSVDKGSRIYTGMLSGILNCFAYLGASMYMFLFKFLESSGGNGISVFVSIEIMCLLMVILGVLAAKKDIYRRKI